MLEIKNLCLGAITRHGHRWGVLFRESGGEGLGRLVQNKSHMQPRGLLWARCSRRSSIRDQSAYLQSGPSRAAGESSVPASGLCVPERCVCCSVLL